MTKATLKNRGNGPRGIIDINGAHHVAQVDGEIADVDLDDITLAALQEGSEAGGDFEVAAGAPTRKGESHERAKLEK